MNVAALRAIDQGPRSTASRSCRWRDYCIAKTVEQQEGPQFAWLSDRFLGQCQRGQRLLGLARRASVRAEGRRPLPLPSRTQEPQNMRRTVAYISELPVVHLSFPHLRRNYVPKNSPIRLTTCSPSWSSATRRTST